jgi:TRAP-type C4-dicarboxylate transport system permease small subunit
MLWVTWLMFKGSLAQARINWDVEAPVTGASMAWVYMTGVVFAAVTALILLRELWAVLAGQPLPALPASSGGH